MGDADGGLFESGPEALLALAQSLLGVLAFGNVAGDRRSAYDIALRVLNRGDGQRDVKPPAVFGQAYGLEVVYLLPPPEAFEYSGYLVGAFRRHQHGD